MSVPGSLTGFCSQSLYSDVYMDPVNRKMAIDMLVSPTGPVHGQVFEG